METSGCSHIEGSSEVPAGECANALDDIQKAARPPSAAVCDAAKPGRRWSGAVCCVSVAWGEARLEPGAMVLSGLVSDPVFLRAYPGRFVWLGCHWRLARQCTGRQAARGTLLG